MTTALANTAVLDRAAMGRGPGTAVAPLLLGGNPQQVIDHADDLREQARRLGDLSERLRRQQTRLARSWPTGDASSSALDRLDRTVRRLDDTIAHVVATAARLDTAATVLRGGQDGFNQVVTATSPAVAAMWSNPFTRGAATAVSVGTTSSLAAFLGTLGKIMDAVGLGELGKLFTSLGTITTDLQTVFRADATLDQRFTAAKDLLTQGQTILGLLTGGGQPAATAPAVGQLPGATASDLGSALPAGLTLPIADGSPPPTGGQTAGGAGGVPAPVTTGLTGPAVPVQGTAPVHDGTTPGWIAVDPSSVAVRPADGQVVPAGHPPATTSPVVTAGGGTTHGDTTPVATTGDHDHAVVTAQRGDLTVSVSVPTDEPIDLTIRVDGGDTDLEQRVTVDADGRVGVA